MSGIDLGSVEDIPVGEGRAFAVEDEQVAVPDARRIAANAGRGVSASRRAAG